MADRSIPRLHLISDPDPDRLREFLSIAVAAARGGVDAVHIRIPGSQPDTLRPQAQKLREILPGNCALIINTHVALADEIGADGVQLTECSISPETVRAQIASQILIGRSVHDLAGAIKAEREGADYLIAGHVYPTGSKPGQEARGISFIREISQNVSLPVIGIGGITRQRVSDVVCAGAWGAAVLSAITLAADPEDVARGLKYELLRSVIGDE